MFIHIPTQERNQEPSVGQHQYGRRPELFNASYHIRLHLHEGSPGSHLPSQASLVDSAIGDEKTRPLYIF